MTFVTLDETSSPVNGVMVGSASMDSTSNLNCWPVTLSEITSPTLYGVSLFKLPLTFALDIVSKAALLDSPVTGPKKVTLLDSLVFAPV